MNRQFLLDLILECRNCELSGHRRQAVLPQGDWDSGVFFLGQAPGETENQSGHPFCGPSGSILDLLFREAEFTRNEVYLTNLVKCHPPHNRRVRKDEIAACSCFVDQEICLVKPRLIIPLGFYATRYIFDYLGKMNLIRADFPGYTGKIIEFSGFSILPLAHPAVVFHQPQLEKSIMKKYFAAGNLIRRFRNS